MQEYVYPNLPQPVAAEDEDFTCSFCAIAMPPIFLYQQWSIACEGCNMLAETAARCLLCQHRTVAKNWCDEDDAFPKWLSKVRFERPCGYKGKVCYREGKKCKGCASHDVSK